jgi:hypothetical protein
MDERMRKRLCEERITEFIPVLCKYKACRFYEMLNTDIIMGWLKNEEIDVLTLHESILDAYLLS